MNPSHNDPIDPIAWIDTELNRLSARNLRRKLCVQSGPQQAKSVVDGREWINFGSNDYLGLAADPRLAQAAASASAAEGWGSGASPLLGGNGGAHARLAEDLANFEATEAAIVFSSGYAANLATVAALVGPGDCVFTDAKNHASILDGCRLSRADVRAFPHQDVDRLAVMLSRSAHRRRLIVTDTLFSMDGDFARLAEIAALSRQFGAMLMVDEAHATGVFGPCGRGLVEELGLESAVHVRVGTLSKAIGCSGGFVAGSHRLIAWLVQRARAYVFSTAPPRPTMAAASAALRIVHEESWRRSELLRRAALLREALCAEGWNIGASASQIVPLVVGEAGRAVALSGRLRELGLVVPAIRPPTVPEGEACLRVSLTFGHDDAALARLTESLSAVR